MTPDEESKLNVWLKKILPQVEEELNYGVTYVEKDNQLSTLHVIKHQILDSNQSNMNDDGDKDYYKLQKKVSQRGCLLRHNSLLHLSRQQLTFTTLGAITAIKW